MTYNPLILVAEDEKPIGTLLKYNLEQADFRVVIATDGQQALKFAAQEKPDLVLLDWMLPIVTGIEVCRQLRAQTTTALTPIIMVTARGEEAERIRGLDTGADDYVVKPFSPAELIARIRALLRRSQPEAPLEKITLRDVEMDLTAHKVIRAGSEVHLGPTEFKLLRHFMQNPEKVFSREDLLKAVWGENIYVEIRTVDVHIRRLRSALHEFGSDDLIRTVRSEGYAFNANAS